jgi:hypothetical protein
VVEDKLVGTLSGGLSEYAGKVIGTEANLLSKRLKREILVEMCQDEIEEMIQLAGG